MNLSLFLSSVNLLNYHSGNGSCGSASPGLGEDLEGVGGGGDESADGDDDCSGGGSGARSKRGVLPRHATQAMRAWLFQHLVVSGPIGQSGVKYDC